jgi:hypothetical protein
MPSAIVPAATAESRMPKLGIAKYTMKICSSTGVLRMTST